MDFESAIHNRELVSFTYDGLYRVAQPATYGRTRTGKLSLRACLVAGDSARNTPPCWELYTIEKMGNVSLVGETFEAFDLAGYTRGDSAFAEILAEH